MQPFCSPTKDDHYVRMPRPVVLLLNYLETKLSTVQKWSISFAEQKITHSSRVTCALVHLVSVVPAVLFSSSSFCVCGLILKYFNVVLLIILYKFLVCG